MQNAESSNAASHLPVLQLYGLFMVTWSVLETAVQTAIIRELNVDASKGIVITSGMQFRQRVSVLSSLLRLATPTQSEAIALLGKIEKKTKRNMLVHGHIIVGVPGELTFVKSSATEGEGLKAKKATFNEAQLLRHINELNSEIKRLQALLNLSDTEMEAVSNEALRVASSEV